jgi:hypothetical protein
MTAAVMGPGESTPERDIMTADARKTGRPCSMVDYYSPMWGMKNTWTGKR